MHYNDEFFQVQISTAYSYEKLKQLANAIVSSAKILQSKYLLWSKSALDLTLLILSKTCVDTARCVMASRLVEHMGKNTAMLARQWTSYQGLVVRIKKTFRTKRDTMG